MSRDIKPKYHQLAQVLDHLIILAVRAHSGQGDLGGMPYILHPIAVAAQADTIEEAILGIAHDLIEDTKVTINDLFSIGVPADILQSLELLTHADDMPYAEYIMRIKADPLARKVKLADIDNNLKPSRLAKLSQKRQMTCRVKYELARQWLMGTQIPVIPEKV